MGKPVQVPDPIYDEISRIAEREDIPRGVVVKQWKEKADKYEEVERR